MSRTLSYDSILIIVKYLDGTRGVASKLGQSQGVGQDACGGEGNRGLGRGKACRAPTQSKTRDRGTNRTEASRKRSLAPLRMTSVGSGTGGLVDKLSAWLGMWPAGKEAAVYVAMHPCEGSKPLQGSTTGAP
jgi:hypothetical protein